MFIWRCDLIWHFSFYDMYNIFIEIKSVLKSTNQFIQSVWIVTIRSNSSENSICFELILRHLFAITFLWYLWKFWDIKGDEHFVMLWLSHQQQIEWLYTDNFFSSNLKLCTRKMFDMPKGIHKRLIAIYNKHIFSSPETIEFKCQTNVGYTNLFCWPPFFRCHRQKWIEHIEHALIIFDCKIP